MFDERLQATLTLTIGPASVSILAGSLETIELDARVYGFSAEVSFRVSSETGADALFLGFNSNELIKATLTLANGRLAMAGLVPEVVTFVGYVESRSFIETTVPGLTGSPVIERLYRVGFADAARVFWAQHRPLSLYSNQSIKDLLDANVVQGVSLEYDWPLLEEARDVLCVGLGGSARASFYDFVMWLVADGCGVIEFNSATSTYRLGGDKSDLANTVPFEAECVSELKVVHPPLQRQANRVLNPFTEAARFMTDVVNDDAASGVRRDVVAYFQVEKQVEQRATTEGQRLRQRRHHLEVRFGRLPAVLPIPLAGLSVGEGFSSRLYVAGNSYRSIRMKLVAQPAEDDSEAYELEAPAKRFAIDLLVELEREADAVPVLPAFEPPVYPVLAEGKVLSASGSETDRTWHALTSSDDSIPRYRVQVPLWNKKVVVPFVPGGESGHFFFPAYKNQRVLLAFEFASGKIVGFLDWVSNLAIETQGNQLIMGKRANSQTLMKHVYTDDSPVLTVLRSQAGDQQTIELSEGRFFLEVKADDSQAETSESYDLTPEADMAKDAANAQARAGIANLSGQYQASMSSASGELNGATSELEGGVSAAANTLSDKTASVEAQLSSQASELQALADDLDQKVQQAKDDLLNAVAD
jgi:hypothetical protein